MDGVRDLYAARGIILKPVDLTDLFLYVTYDGLRDTANNWGMKPGGFALAGVYCECQNMACKLFIV
jgi:hypothetical protein